MVHPRPKAHGHGRDALATGRVDRVASPTGERKTTVMTIFGVWRRTAPLLTALTALSALLMGPAAARAQTAPDSIGTTDEWLLHPEQPCVDDDVVLYVRGFRPTPCDSFIFAGRTGERQVLVRSLIREGYACFVGPIPSAIPIHFGTMAAGSQSIELRHEYLVLHPDGSIDSTTYTIHVGFDVTPTCGTPPPVPADRLPFVSSVYTVPFRACPERATSVDMLFSFPDGCGYIVSAGNDNGHLSVAVAPYHTPGTFCPLRPPSPPIATLPLGFLQAGSYHVAIDLTVQGLDTVWPPIFDQQSVGIFDFAVSSPCDTMPGTSLPFVDFIKINGPDSLSTPCPGQPIPVVIGGMFPDDCYKFDRIELLNYWVGPGPATGPPIVRVIVDDTNCLLLPCREGPFAWGASVMLPPLPAGDYPLTVQLADAPVCRDTILPGDLFTTTVPLRVVASAACSTQVFHCLAGEWLRQDGQTCNAFISGDHPAQPTFEVRTNTALSGLQGTLRFVEAGLSISQLATVGAAAGMHLSWVRTNDGARFVMFADHGAPIGASAAAQPVLQVTAVFGPAPGNQAPQIPAAFHLVAENLLGSDVDAQDVRDCADRYGRIPLPPIALICVEQGCDFNGDGVADVRDLVLMVHCVNGDGPCPPETTHFDCDGDGRFTLGDVLCCAIQVLRGPVCPECADSIRVSAARSELGVPVKTVRGVDVPIRISDAIELGAARLALRFPADRYRLSGVDLVQGPEWLQLHQDSPSGATLGLIRVQPSAQGAAVEAVLHLELLLGMKAGGEIQLESGDYSATDGVRLQVQTGETTRALGGALTLALSPARPNPFTGETRFTVTLDGDAVLDVGIYDIGGRRLAELFHGSKGPGAHAFTWDGRASDGAPAREGIYFYRVTGAGRSATGKVALLRVK